jgi:hypothetical protein
MCRGRTCSYAIPNHTIRYQTIPQAKLNQTR